MLNISVCYRVRFCSQKSANGSANMRMECERIGVLFAVRTLFAEILRMGSVIVCDLVEGVSVTRPGEADHLAREDERVHQLAELGRGEVEVLEELVV